MMNFILSGVARHISSYSADDGGNRGGYNKFNGAPRKPKFSRSPSTSHADVDDDDAGGGDDNDDDGGESSSPREVFQQKTVDLKKAVVLRRSSSSEDETFADDDNVPF